MTQCLPDMAVISQQAVPSTPRGCLTFPHHQPGENIQQAPLM